MELEYRKEGNRNYIRYRKNSAENEIFTARMLEQNNIPGLLKTFCKNINDEQFIYYDITSLQSLENILLKKSMNEDDMNALFHSLQTVNCKMEEYLLDTEMLIIKENCIFYNLDTKEFLFLCDPYEKEEKIEQWGDFVEYLITKTDIENVTLLEKIYSVYDHVMNNTFTVQKMISIMLDPRKEEKQENPEPIEAETINIAVVEKIAETESIKSGNLFMDNWMKILSFFCVASGIYFIFLFFYYDLTGKEQLLVCSGFVAVIVTGILSMLFQKKNKQQDKSIKDTDMLLEKEENQTSEIPHTEKEWKLVLEENKGQEISDTEGKTQFIIPDPEELEDKLYGIGKNKKIITLDKMPYIIGKAKDLVDFALKDGSVSRIHAKITKYNGKTFLTDMNSTNGTFRNGLRLEPNERIEIEKEDEIRLGKLEFVYR
ncbi:MAG: DUF6382 domain-containing protein [Lachnospiraceae bacterium]|nr:DUF6382 domain-containing protein [Lachnospiraceae bacterium]